MTCQEVIDLMQRYLDKDLNDKEDSALMEHLSDCSNCPVIFEKMKLLSSELTLLPKVTPPFSLVDRILPQLDEMDRTGSVEDQHAAAQKSSPLLLWGKRNFKAISGVAAAAIVFIWLISNGLPNSFQSAGDMLGGSSNDNAAVMENANAPASDGDINRSMIMDTESSANDSTMNKSSGFMKDSTESSQGLAANEEEKMDTMEVRNDVGEPQMMMSITGSEQPMDAADDQYPSPNGEYTAYIKQDGSQYQVFVVNTQNEELYVSPVEEADRMENIQWTEDSKYFEYELVIGESVTRVEVTVEP
jgi:hypothetical protein